MKYLRKNKKKQSELKKTATSRKASFTEHSSSDELDIEFYSSYYLDLSNMNNAELKQHWNRFGKSEGRYPSFEAYAASKNLADLKDLSDIDIDLDFYLALYEDLVLSGINKKTQAQLHYLENGRHEKRAYSYKHWVDSVVVNQVDKEVLSSEFIKQAVSKIVKTPSDLPYFLKTLTCEKQLPISVYGSELENFNLYRRIGYLYLENREVLKTRIFFKIALSFKQDSIVYELIANTYLDERYFETASGFYKKSIELGNDSYWVYLNLHNCYVEQQRYLDAVKVLYDGYRTTNHSNLEDATESLLETAWNIRQSKLDVYAVEDNRDAVFSYNEDFASFLYQIFSSTQDSSKSLPLKKINQNRVLIVGDFHVEQCVRYRINQKIEQLELQGIQVKSLDWTKLNNAWNELSFYDIVIFYRVPSVPNVLKAIAEVNAAGKLSIYEIDDLLFDKQYPPAIETYGGYVDLHVYHELIKGAGLFNAAAKHCRIGLASTLPLASSLSEVVQENTCLLHRNGLDSLNECKIIDKTHKNTIDIFYGSGTQAHNTDFTEQVMPALDRILESYPNVRLIIAGYLNLPQAFKHKFIKQIKQIPPVKDVKHYWSLLEHADINIAVLHEDKITNAKSELKWFEAACFAIPSILSSTQNYRDVIQHNTDALLVHNTEEWYQGLKLLINDSAKRIEMGLNAQQRVMSEYSPETLGESLAHQLNEYVEQKTPVKQRKKLIIVNVFFAPQSIGGATRVVEDNLDVMLDKYSDEYDITVFTADANCRESHKLTSYQYKGINVFRVTTLFREHMDWHPKDSEMYKIFTQFLQNEQPDLVHFHCVQRLTASVVEATKSLEIPYYITVHDAWWISDYQFLVDENDNVYPNGHPDPFSIIPLPTNITLEASFDRRIYLKELINSAEKVFIVSESFADIYRNNGIQNIVVTKNGLSENIEWQPKSTTHTDKVVCALIGGMSGHKGYEILKLAIQKAQPKNCEFIFVDHSKESGYESTDKWGNVPVKFVGREKQENIVDLYKKIDVLFAPSIWPESFGLVTREAAACGCWVVASNLGGIGEDVVHGESGYAINPTTKDLINVLNLIDQDKEKYKSIVTNYSHNPVSNQVKQIVEFYK